MEGRNVGMHAYYEGAGTFVSVNSLSLSSLSSPKFFAQLPLSVFVTLSSLLLHPVFCFRVFLSPLFFPSQFFIHFFVPLFCIISGRIFLLLASLFITQFKSNLAPPLSLRR